MTSTPPTVLAARTLRASGPSVVCVIAVVVVLASIAGVPTSASACRMERVDVFEQSREAYRVAVGTVTDTGVEVSSVLKGSKVDMLDIPEWPPTGRHTNCVYDPDPGTDVLVFVDESSELLYFRQSVMPVEKPVQPPFSVTEAFIDELEGYIDADRDTERRKILFGMLTNEEDELVKHAFDRVYDHPGWWDELSNNHLTELTEALEQHDYPEKAPFWMLIRMRHRGVVHPLIDQVDGPWSHLAAEGLRVLLNRPLRDIQKHQANGTTDQVIDELNAWIEAHPDDWFASGYKRRGLPVPKTFEALADRIAAGPAKVDRLVAIAACERKAESRLIDDHIYTDGVDEEDEWDRIASVCRVAGRAEAD